MMPEMLRPIVVERDQAPFLRIIRPRAPRLDPDGRQLVAEGLATGAWHELTPRQQDVLRRRYACPLEETPPTYEQIADDLGLKGRARRTSIRDVENTGLDNLRRLLNRQGEFSNS